MGSNMAQTTTNRTTDRTGDSHGQEEEAIQFNYRLPEGAEGFDAERLHDYVPGGYHPVALGDVLGDGGRFRVVHKLGFGGYATVWLCHDKTSKKWRAIKIMAAAASTPDCADLKALELFKGVDPDELAANHIQLALDHFWIDGPNGRHLCFVLPFLGTNLTYLYGRYGHVPDLMKDICFQLVKALEFIHSHGLCHGDFRPDNILIRLAEGVDEWEEEMVMKKLLGPPALVPVEHVDGLEAEREREPGVPAYLVECSSIHYGSGACASEIAVIDFGVSYHASQPPVGKGTGIPMPYAAPEELLEQDQYLGFCTDIWALGVTIAKVRCGFTPFADEYDDFLGGLEKLEAIMGPMPEPYRTAWKGCNGVFINCQDKNGEHVDEDSWKDESVLATIRTDKHEYTHRCRIGEGRAANYLHYRMQCGLIMNVDDKMAADIASQAASNPRRMPAYPCGGDEDARFIDYRDKLDHTMHDSEISQMFDLFLGMFKWHTEQRATLDQIANHAWFGDRASRRQLAAPPPPAAPSTPGLNNNVNTNTTDDNNTLDTNNKRPRSASPTRPGKKPRCTEEEAVADDSGQEVAGNNPGAVTGDVVGRGLSLPKGPGCWTMRGILSWFMGKIAGTFHGLLRVITNAWRRRRTGEDHAV